MAFISSLAKIEKFKRFKEHLRNGNVEGVRENLELQYVDGIIDTRLILRPIHWACEKGHFEIVNLLIEKKCNIESENILGWRPIHFACSNGSIKIVKLLIAHKCLINVSTEDGRTSLNIAKSKGHWEIVKLLSELDKITKQINDSILKNDVKNFAKFYNSDLLTSGNWLEIAWKQNADKIIKYFLDTPINVKEIDYFKTVIENHPSESTNVELCEEVLLYKSIKGHHEGHRDKDSFECLLNIEIKNPFCFGNGESLLTRLLIEERFYFCQRIIKSKVNKKYINFKNERNQTPLQVAIETDSRDLILNDLVFETDVIDNMDCEGRTALMQLFVNISDKTNEDRHSRLINAIKTIIYKGGNIYHKTSNGKTAIEFCSSSLVREEIEAFQNNQNNFTNPVREKIIEGKTCGICLDREVDSVLECGHTICEVCSGQIFRCPFCNFEPVRAKRIYFN